MFMIWSAAAFSESLKAGAVSKRARTRCGQAQGKTQRGRRAHGLAADDGLLDAQGVHHGSHVAGHPIQVIERRIGDRCGVAVAALVVDDDPIAVGERRKLAASAVAVAGQAVGEDQPGAVAKCFDGQFDTVTGNAQR